MVRSTLARAAERILPGRARDPKRDSEQERWRTLPSLREKRIEASRAIEQTRLEVERGDALPGKLKRAEDDFQHLSRQIAILENEVGPRLMEACLDRSLVSQRRDLLRKKTAVLRSRTDAENRLGTARESLARCESRLKAAKEREGATDRVYGGVADTTSGSQIASYQLSTDQARAAVEELEAELAELREQERTIGEDLAELRRQLILA